MKYKLVARIGDKHKLVDFECVGNIRDEFPDLFTIFGSESSIVDAKDERLDLYNNIAYKHFGKLFQCERCEFDYCGYMEADEYDRKTKQPPKPMEDILKEINKGDKNGTEEQSGDSVQERKD